jgi:hypothetical protein
VAADLAEMAAGKVPVMLCFEQPNGMPHRARVSSRPPGELRTIGAA